MNKLAEQLQTEFFAWAEKRYSIELCGKLRTACEEMNHYFLGRKLLTKPFFETTDMDTLYRVQNVIRTDKFFRFFHKKSVDALSAAIDSYITFLFLKRQAIQNEPPATAPVSPMASATPEVPASEESAPAEPESDEVIASEPELPELDHAETRLPIPDNWIRYDFTNKDDFKETLPEGCTIGGDPVGGKNWARLYVHVVEREIERGNPKLNQLYHLPLGQGEAPFFMRDRVPNANCAKMSNGMWIKINYNIPGLVMLAGKFCLFCGYSRDEIILNGVPKTSKEQAKVVKQQVSASTKKEVASSYYRVTQGYEDYARKTRREFISWMMDHGMAKSSTMIYLSALKKCSVFAQEQRYADCDLYLIRSSEALQEIKTRMFADESFAYLNRQNYLHLQSALNKYIEFRAAGENVRDALTYASRRKYPSDPLTQPESGTAVPSHMPSGLQGKAEDQVLAADLDGISMEKLSAQLKAPLTSTKEAVKASGKIVEMEDRLIHEDALIDWEETRQKLDSILDKLMEKNDGYVSAAQLYEFAHAEMQMFLNDHDMDDKSSVYCLARHLFEKNHFRERHYTFSAGTHISRADREVSTIFDLIGKFSEEHGGFFPPGELDEYLKSLGTGGGNLSYHLRLNSQPSYFHYDEVNVISAASMCMDDQWFETLDRALKALFDDVGDHIVLRNIQPGWYRLLPTLPGNREWTPLLLQGVLKFYGGRLHARTISAPLNQAVTVLHAMLVTENSEVQSFPDAVVAALVDGQTARRHFEAEQLRRLLAEAGLISGNQLIGKIPEILSHDPRFAWDSDGKNVTVKL